MTDEPLDTNAADSTAAELALGLLDGDERAAALRRVLAEPGFARDVERWRLHFAQLFDLWPEAHASDDVVDRIDASLGMGRSRMGAVSRWRFPWPALAIASTAVAAALLVFVGTRQPVPAAPVAQSVPSRSVSAAAPLLVASLDASGAPVPAVFDTSAGSLRVAAAPATPDARVAQLWVIGGDGVPHAIGLLKSASNIVVLSPADRARIANGATLAISIEPIGGSPTGLPTGPVVAKGVLARI